MCASGVVIFKCVFLLMYHFYTHISNSFADESQLSGLVHRVTHLTSVAAVWRHGLGICDEQI